MVVTAVRLPLYLYHQVEEAWQKRRNVYSIYLNLLLMFFTDHPLLSMTLSTFSHISVIHLSLNMYVLWSFGSAAANLLGFEQFAAFYVSAGK